MRILILLLLALPCFASDYYRQVVLQDPGLVSFWRLGEASGNFTDLKGGNTATANGGITYAQTGPIVDDSSTGVAFNGSTGYAAVANRSPFAFEYNQPFTLECWASRTTGGIYTLMGKMLGSGTAVTGYNLMWNSNDVEIYIINDIGAGRYIHRKIGSISGDNTWKHFVVTYSGSGVASGVSLYIDGVAQTLTTLSDTLASSTILANVDFTFGDRANGGCCFFSGSMADVAVYNRVLSADDVQKHYSFSRWPAVSRSTSAPLNVILDNDSAVDIDNAYQIQQFIRMGQLGYFNLVGYINSDSTTYGVVCSDIQFRYGGFAPTIGAYQLGDAQSVDDVNCGAYASEFKAGIDRTDYTDDTTVYRSLLSAAPNGSITLVVAASAVSLYQLMTTAGSPSGISLLTDKVAKVIWVAGIYSTGCEYNFGCQTASAPIAYATTANYVLANWPTSVPIEFVGIEQGDSVIIGQSKYATNIVSGSPFAYMTYDERPDWDGLGNWRTFLPSNFTVTGSNGNNVVNSTTGVNTWSSSPNNGMDYVTKALADSVYVNRGNYLITYNTHPWGATW